uniref:Protein fucoxanthin chlorophyll a c protein n=1 Tax=Nannochloropsis gaditana (strain CCMP526) TaxID=1093141 RepID=I2CPJ1_NANGC
MVGLRNLCLAAAVTMASVSAFVPPAPSAPRTRGVVNMGLDGMIGSSAPFKNFDPLGFAAKADQKTLNKYRESELKHGRVAMLAVLGWVVQEVWHPLYDGKLSSNPLKALTEVPLIGWAQIFVAINVIEYLQNKIKELPGYRPGDYLGTWEWVEQSDEGWDNYQTKELNNGRLAMVAIAGLIAQDLITGQAALEQISAGNTGVFSGLGQ